MEAHNGSDEIRHLRAELRRERTARVVAEAANQANDEMLNSISHKLRNPLNTIMLWSQVLREQPGDRTLVTRALDGLDQAARLQIRMIDTLLDMSRIALGRLRLEVEDVPLRPIVESAVEASRPLAVAKAITLELDLAGGLIAVAGDATRLGQVIWHVLSNAIRRSPRGSTVWVRLHRTDTLARVSVRDSGPGIESSRLPTMFDLPQPGGASSSDDTAGLGLPLTRHIVELHGGTVQAESPGHGEGATLSFELPLLGPSKPAVVDRSAVPGATVPGETVPVSLGGLRILIVEDEPSARDSMRIILQRCGAEVAAVGSARQALETLAEGRFDVLVSDIAMPGGDGYELLRRVRALAPEDGGQIPAVAVTAQTGPESRSRALEGGFQLYLNKPVDAAHLVRLVTALGGRARAV